MTLRKPIPICSTTVETLLEQRSTTNFFDASGHPYDREHPKPQTAQHVAGVAVRAIERNRRDIFASAFMRQALITKTLIPPAFRMGSIRAFAKELAEMRGR